MNNHYKAPHFVLSHNIPKTTAKGDTTFFFVSQGIEVAIQQAKEIANDKYVVIGGGADIAQQLIKSRLLDEIQFHLVPVILGVGIQLFENLNAMNMDMEKIKVVESVDVTHLRFRVVK